jgi:IS5 family transposase
MQRCLPKKKQSVTNELIFHTLSQTYLSSCDELEEELKSRFSLLEICRFDQRERLLTKRYCVVMLRSAPRSSRNLRDSSFPPHTALCKALYKPRDSENQNKPPHSFIHFEQTQTHPSKLQTKKR